MTQFYFLRHAESQANLDGILAGCIPGVALSPRGRRQSLKIAKTLADVEFRAIYSSPLERALQTVRPLARTIGKRIRISDSFMEMDYGSWSGRSLASLKSEALWKRVQREPSKVTFPGGESFRATERRVLRGIKEISKAHPQGKVLVVSHGDPIRIALQIALKGELDDFQRLIVDPASISIIQWPDKIIYGVNQRIADFPSANSKANRTMIGGGTDRA